MVKGELDYKVSMFVNNNFCVNEWVDAQWLHAISLQVYYKLKCL